MKVIQFNCALWSYISLLAFQSLLLFKTEQIKTWKDEQKQTSVADPRKYCRWLSAARLFLCKLALN